MGHHSGMSVSMGGGSHGAGGVGRGGGLGHSHFKHHHSNNADTAAGQAGALEAMSCRAAGVRSLGGSDGSVGGVGGRQQSALSLLGATGAAGAAGAGTPGDALSILRGTNSNGPVVSGSALQNSSDPSRAFAPYFGPGTSGGSGGATGLAGKINQLSQLGDNSLQGVLPAQGQSGADYCGMSQSAFAALSHADQVGAVKATFLKKLSSAVPAQSSSSPTTGLQFSDLNKAVDDKLKAALQNDNVSVANWDLLSDKAKKELVAAAIAAQHGVTPSNGVATPGLSTPSSLSAVPSVGGASAASTDATTLLNQGLGGSLATMPAPTSNGAPAGPNDFRSQRGQHRRHHHPMADQAANDQLTRSVGQLAQLKDPVVQSVLPPPGQSGASYTGMSTDQWSQLSPAAQKSAVQNAFQQKLAAALGITPQNGSSSATTDQLKTAVNNELRTAISKNQVNTDNWSQLGNAGQWDLFKAAVAKVQGVSPSSLSTNIPMSYAA